MSCPFPSTGARAAPCGRLDRRQAVVRPWARLVEALASPSGTGKPDAEIALMTRPRCGPVNRAPATVKTGSGIAEIGRPAVLSVLAPG
ncbi:MAG: hypothetical protein QOG78_724 [Rhodospirillaceae bacterium]|nr:hypothetical protein [Rhodospirillaceae bacterium]